MKTTATKKIATLRFTFGSYTETYLEEVDADMPAGAAWRPYKGATIEIISV